MFFTDSHEWISVEGEIGTVGMTSFAQKELGEVVFVELPSLGKMVNAGEEIAILESTKAATDIYSPVTGEIVAVNTALKTATHLLNQSPEQEGWLFKIKLTKPAELATLLDKEQYAMINS